MTDRVGYYCWAGPGTIRMINLKFFQPPIDQASLMHSYDYDYLAKAKDKLGITDCWATYSWGFSDKTEEVDRNFLLARRDNFKKLGLKLHAYIQGPNLVYSDFIDKDWFCCDERGRLVTYYRGRRVTCLNNPNFVEYLINKIEGTYGLGFDGIFLDNIQMGQITIPTYGRSKPFVFAGCYCKHCQQMFFKQTGESIPTDLEQDQELTQVYLKWRVAVTTNFIKTVAEKVHNGQMEFGTNSFDPRLDTKTLLGVDLKQISYFQDYLLFENHALTDSEISNLYIDEIISKMGINKPVFVISYKKGIGLDQEFSQNDFNKILSEDRKLKLMAMIKGSEYVSNGVWHNLRIGQLDKVTISDTTPQKHVFRDGVESRIISLPLVRWLLKKYYNPLFTYYMESQLGRKLFTIVQQLVLH